jgi:hypothetical protein
MLKNRPQAYQEWIRVVTKQMSHLSKPQAVVLAMWSFAIAMTHCCGLSTVTVFLAQLLEQPENSIREQLRQWYREGGKKYGRKRSQLEVSKSFRPLLSWILSWWSQEERSLVLAADASTLGSRFTLLVISVVYRGCGIPVAWKIVEATEKGSWKPHWLSLLQHLEGGVPKDWLVIVTTDRGLYAKWFYEAIQQLGWHPFMRINHQGHYQLHQNQSFMPLSELISEVGQHWSGKAICFKSNLLSCTLLGNWETGYADPWLIVTDLSPQQAQICWYSMRSWIECLFKDIKRGGLGWHQTKMTAPQRAERLWLAIAVATLWLVSVGGLAEADLSASSLPSLSEISTNCEPELNSSENHFDPSLEINSPGRVLSCFRRGFLTILASLIKGMPLPIGSFIPNFSPATG